MTKNESYISFIKDYFRKGIFERSAILPKCVKKWQCSERTFDRYWKKAQIEHSKEVRDIENKKAEHNKQLELEASKVSIIGKIEKRELLAKIIRSDILLDRTVSTLEGFKNIKTKPYPLEILKAIELDNKMAGDYAPTKIAETDVEGNDKKESITVTTLLDLLKG